VERAAPSRSSSDGWWVWNIALKGTKRPVQLLRILNDRWRYLSRKTKRRGGKTMTHSGLYHLHALHELV